MLRTTRYRLQSRPVALVGLYTSKSYNDPFPNLAIRHSKEAALDTSYPNLPPIPRPNETTEDKRRRLIYQSRKRGILETDLLLI
ncbi:hypothetical protein G6F57_023571 [Rhizopus arrhizus]|nr:hypothetical protein G6F57_023571 [Rhizopus arrhizus]